MSAFGGGGLFGSSNAQQQQAQPPQQPGQSGGLFGGLSGGAANTNANANVATSMLVLSAQASGCSSGSSSPPSSANHEKRQFKIMHAVARSRRPHGWGWVLQRWADFTPFLARYDREIGTWHRDMGEKTLLPCGVSVV